jgi:quercetin dioxygenase-like cupin family protein
VLVAREGGQVLGFGSFGDFRAWPGYRTTVEHTVHVAAAHRRKGIGRQLVEALIRDARALGMHVMIAGVDAANEGSLALHTRLGFVEVGRFPEIARKFDRWIDLVLLQLALDEADEPPAYRVLPASEAFWRPSNQMGVLNTDFAKQLDMPFAARLWRLLPGQASSRHRHLREHELYVLLEGTGRLRVEQELLTLSPLSAVAVSPSALRQVFNDTGEDALWLVVGAPAEGANTSHEVLARLYPDGPKALPPELA